MRLRDYFLGIPIVGHSPLSPRECEAKIEGMLKTDWNPFAQGMTGYAKQGRLYLNHRSWSEYNLKPVITGHLVPKEKGCDLRLRYQAPVGARIYFVLWFAFFALLSGSVSKEPILVAVAFSPIALHYLGTWGSEERLTRMLRFLEEVALVGTSADSPDKQKGPPEGDPFHDSKSGTD